MITSVVFDWGGVLTNNHLRDLIKYNASYLGTNPEELRPIIAKLLPDFQRGVLLEKEMWGEVAQLLNCKTPKVKSLWANAFSYAFAPRKMMIDYAKKVKKKGYKTALLSNMEYPGMMFFQKLNYDMFDIAVFSCAEGCRKPEKKIYNIVLERLSSYPEETIFIDDQIENIKGAKKLGINAVLFESAMQLKKDLKELGI